MINLPPAGLLLLVSFWATVYIVDSWLKRSRKYGLRYQESLHVNGLTFSLIHIRWQTTLFNKYFMRVGRWKPKWLLHWFNMGVMFGCVAMVMSVVLLSGMLYKSFTELKPNQMLQPVMPGMNLPWNQIGYYVITLIIAGAFHEVGHAIAAVRENVRVNSFGLFLLFVYPGAFVELHTDQLEIITPFRKLRIYTAGVWHNCVLAFCAYLFSCLLPYLLQSFYLSNQGAVVTWISQQSSIYHNLPVSDVITSINHCQVSNTADWYDCLRHVQTNPVEGFCNSQKFVQTHNTSLPYLVRRNDDEWDCCNDTSAYRFCFYYDRIFPTKILIQKNITNESSNVNKLVRTSDVFASTFREYACLPARSTLSDKQFCLTNGGCLNGYVSDSFCLKPYLSNTTNLLRITHQKGQDVLFVGDIMELYSYIALSNYVPKYTVSLLHLPQHLNILAMYFLSISSALAILNMVPCFFLDGHQALNALLELFLPGNSRFKTYLETCILISGSILLTVNILIGLYTLSR